ncbi:MAG: efflux RND transporter permease subunit [Deltaproteobacteria bacterium]|nr:efflux RND transporter permease subunit [Deltaproteobacteria bacterium]
MIEKIIEFSARNKFLVLALTVMAVAIGIRSIQKVPLDAIPDLSDTQVIIYSKWDRSPDIIEDQVTYPIVTSLLGAPKVQAIRGISDFGFSYVYVIFEDGTDVYWARSRTLEYLSKIMPRLPEGVKTELGPDATGVGWVYQYALVDETGTNDLASLRSFQDWNLRFHLQSVPGVAEVASIGGFVKQYQVNINPNALLAYNIPLMHVVEAIRKSNNEVGGRLVEFSDAEYMIRGKGYIKSIADIENIAIGADAKTGTPILVKNLGSVRIGPEMRRGVADLDGKGDAVGGIVVIRYGENALNVIDAVKKKLKEIEPSLPKGVKIVTTYDRSDLIHRAIHTLNRTLIEEMIIVSLVIIIFLWHFPSAIIPIVTIPVAVILSFIPMEALGLTSNIMSLGGIAVAIGALVDASIVVVENAHKKLEKWEAEGRKGNYHDILIEAIKEVARPSFFSLLVIAVSFMPVFTLEAEEGRLFKPLAFTKNFAMAIAAVLAITLSPALQLLVTRFHKFKKGPAWLCALGNRLFTAKMMPEEHHPISQILFKLYDPPIQWVLKHPKRTIQIAVGVVIITIIPFMRLGSEFMPPLNEGAILYMPTSLPGISVSEAERTMQIQDRILKSFPEVERVYGKVGRADTSTDPAPFSMAETTVVLKPEKEWRKVKRWYSWMPSTYHFLFRWFWPDRISWEELIAEMNAKLQLPGWTNAWTMPIKNRIDMLATGIRTPVGIKVFGSDFKKIEEIGGRLEGILKEVKGTRSVYAERVAGGYFLDFDLRRDHLARYGLTVADAQMIIMSAIGGENITTTVEGRGRFPVNLRYAREQRDDLDDLKRVLVPTPSGAQIPLTELADISLKTGPSMIRDENGMLAGYVFIDMTGRDIGSYVNEAKKVVREKLDLPTGYSLQWSGQYEAMERVKKRLMLVVPLTLMIVFLLLFFNTGSTAKTLIILMAVPFSAVGAIWLLYFLGYNTSVGVWVGLIALLGLDAETGIFMLLFLDLAYDHNVKHGRMRNTEDLKEAIIHGAVKRVRPKVMTVAVAFMGLMPIMWSHGAGADTMKRIAAPMVGGLFTSFIMELLVYPAIYFLWKQRSLPKE